MYFQNELIILIWHACRFIAMWTDLTKLVVLTLLLSVPSGTAVPLNSFYLYGLAVDDSVLPPNDDESSPAITLPAPFLFFGANYYTIYVSHLFLSQCANMSLIT